MPAKIALTGNPNCGKTTLFNRYTGARQYVGNWAGVTVEKKEGLAELGEKSAQLVDLPGIYSLSPYSMEEIITRDYILDEWPGAIIDIVDGTNLERNLYLTVQLMELGVPVVVAVNMIDEVEARGQSIDCEALSALLSVPVLPISAKHGQNVDELLRCALEAAEQPRSRGLAVCGKITYDRTTTRAIDQICAVLLARPGADALPLRFFAGKLLEADPSAADALGLTAGEAAQIERIVAEYEASSVYGDRETMLADARYRYVTGLSRRAVHPAGAAGTDTPPQQPSSPTERIDRVLTHRILAIPLFLLILFLMFSATFGPVGEGLKGLIERLFGDLLTPWATSLLDRAGAPGWSYGLLIDAVLGGVGSVLTFLPQISILFLFLSILEDSGYMARAAFIMDRLLRKIGLTGKSFIPMLMGFGCTTPAVMAARTMENERDRKLTIMITPFMSCGAKLPIYALMCSIFFPRNKGLVILSLYILGALVAVLSGFLLKHTLFRGPVAPFVMELPPYRLPDPASLALHVWDKAKGFLIKAGTVIFSMSVVIWLLQNFDLRLRFVQDNAQSIFASLGRLIAPLLGPLGFGSWQASVSLLAGLVAKETVVSSMAVLYGASGPAGLEATLRGVFTPLSAYTFMVFCLLYSPCISALVSIRRELQSIRWAAATALFGTGAAYLVSFLVYQIGLKFIGG